MSSVDLIFQVVILLFSVVIHEVAHGYAAFLLGDNTARYQGRLTLNPIKHLDLFGSIIFPALLFFSNVGFMVGWAKPVPYNPYNLRNQRWGEAIVAFAGPLSNIVIAIVFGLMIRFGLSFGLISNIEILRVISLIFSINLVLAFFNLIPIPPLDGSKILFTIFKVGYGPFRVFLEKYGIVLVLAFTFFIWPLFFPVIGKLFVLISGIPV